MAYKKHQENMTKLLDWIATNDRVKEHCEMIYLGGMALAFGLAASCFL